MRPYIRTLGVRLLDVPYHLDIEYTYYIPDPVEEDFSVGDFVLVPFGKANKKLCALVTSLGQTKTIAISSRCFPRLTNSSR